jgi:hypothetical protein
MIPHKYADVIKVAADGAQVQLRASDTDQWNDWKSVVHFPSFNLYFQWRIKPPTLRYRVALMRSHSPEGSYYAQSVQDRDHEVEHIEGSRYFVRWLHDWQEVEV